MADLRFSWDERKAASNKEKHGVSFDEATGVFFDERALLLEDDDPQKPEERFLLLGLSASLRVLVVCHCETEDGQEIRIISARRANRAEQKQYWDRVSK